MSCARVAEPPVTAGVMCALFNRLFVAEEGTELCAGADEPLYTPAGAFGPNSPARIHARSDYVSSALHEVAHWCIAGKARRALEDYGYWYEPDGRDRAGQDAFQAVEARPQALEWCFSQACGLPFRISLDNLHAPPDREVHRRFAEAVLAAAREFARNGLPGRAQRFFDALCDEFRPGLRARDLRFTLDDLG
ncbi:MAG: elongation factor P hydroxylase [Pseudomonadota bacterium]